MKMKQRESNGVNNVFFAILIVFVIGFLCGLKIERIQSDYQIDEYKKEIALQEQSKDLEEAEETEEVKEDEEDEIFLEQRKIYFEEIKPIKFYGVDFYQDKKRYEIKTPQEIYEDYACTKKVKNPVITSTTVVEIIMNEENSRFGLRTENNNLVWCKEEPRIEETK